MLFVYQISGNRPEDAGADLKKRHGQAGFELAAVKFVDDAQRQRCNQDILGKQLEKIDASRQQERFSSQSFFCHVITSLLVMVLLVVMTFIIIGSGLLSIFF